MSQYLTKRKLKGNGRYTWTLEPPEDIVQAGIITRKTYRDGRSARAAERYLLKVIKDFRAGKLAGDMLPEDPTFRVLMGHYLATPHFNSLSSNTRDLYIRSLAAIADTPIGNKLVGHIRLSEFNAQMCSKIYNYWVTTKSVPWANDKKRVWGVLFSYAMSLDLVVRNPMANVKAVHHDPETTTWTQEQVEKFLDVAFSQFKYRNIGLMILLCYEWAQRPVDIANLKWDNIDLETDTVTIKQQKRGAVVQLPINENIKALLVKQKEDFDFQEYVLPYLRVQDKAWRPMRSAIWSNLVAEVKELAGLPEELTVGTLRKTGIMEMVESGVDSTGIMQVSGHKNIQSINPYMKHTRAGAKRALDARKGIN